jgi:hypothetical protein
MIQNFDKEHLCMFELWMHTVDCELLKVKSLHYIEKYTLNLVFEYKYSNINIFTSNWLLTKSFL